MINIICAAWNNHEMTKITYESVLKHTKGPFRLILINNGSTDGTQEWMESIPGSWCKIGDEPDKDAQVIKVTSEKNGGCGIGRNIGLRMVSKDAKYVVLIDNDIVLTQGWDEEMVMFMDANPDIGLCGPVTNYAGTPQMIKPAPKKMEEIEGFAANWRGTHVGKASFVPNGLVVIGFCMMIRKTVLDQVGIFDEQFKLYGCEDNDLCNRVRVAGWKLAYFKGIYVHHWGNSALSALGDEGLKQWDENRKKFDAKWRGK